MPLGRASEVSEMVGALGSRYGQTCAQEHELAEVLLALSALGFSRVRHRA